MSLFDSSSEDSEQSNESHHGINNMLPNDTVNQGRLETINLLHNSELNEPSQIEPPNNNINTEDNFISGGVYHYIIDHCFGSCLGWGVGNH